MDNPVRSVLRPIMVHKRLVARHNQARYGWGLAIAISLVLWGIFLMTLGVQLVHAEVYDSEAIVNAIYIVEGGDRAKVPFGVLSVPCKGYEDCRQVALNTVNNNFSRWQLAGSEGDFLEFLRDRYAPLSDSPLNANWLRNLKAVLK